MKKNYYAWITILILGTAALAWGGASISPPGQSTVQFVDGAVVGTLTMSAVANDITTGSNEDLNLTPNGTGDILLTLDSGTILKDDSGTFSLDASGNIEMDGGITFTGGGSLVSTSNGDITIAPNGSGDIIMTSAAFSTDASGNLDAAGYGYFTGGVKTGTVLLPTTAGTSGQVLHSNGTNLVLSTATYPTTATSSGKVLHTNGTNVVASPWTLPMTIGASGKILHSNGTNYVESTATYPTATSAAGKILHDNGTNIVQSPFTMPLTAGAANTYLHWDGTNIVTTTETVAAPGTMGNYMVSSGTNWTSVSHSGFSKVVNANLDMTSTQYDFIQVDAGTAVTITLPTPTNFTGRVFTIAHNNGTTATTIDAGTYSINGAVTNAELNAAGDLGWVIGTGTGWNMMVSSH